MEGKKKIMKKPSISSTLLETGTQYRFKYLYKDSSLKKLRKVKKMINEVLV